MSEPIYNEATYPRVADDGNSDLERETACSVCAQLLVDPMTLSCGHSFCQLCLARLWESKARAPIPSLLCPSCRQPWRQLPALNIQLRDILETVYRERTRKRKNLFSLEDSELVKSFSQARIGSLAIHQLRHRQDIRQIVRVWSVILPILLALVMMMIAGIVLWVRAGAEGQFMRKPVQLWTSTDVLAWIEGLGEWTVPNITRAFQIQALTGPQLLLVDDKALEEFGITQSFRRQTLLQAVEALRTDKYSHPLDFFQFKAAHRSTSLLLVLFYSHWPRLTLFYSYLFEYYTVYHPLGKAQFSSVVDQDAELSTQQEAVLALLLLLLPHIGVTVLAVNWLMKHPWVCAPVLVHCTVAMFKQARALLVLPFHQLLSFHYCKSLLIACGTQVFKFIVCAFVYFIVWPLIPHFICDSIFYLLLWNSLLANLVFPLLKYLYNRFVVT